MFNYKKLMGNTVIFAIGNMGSRFINLLLVPLYTFYLSTNEYGTIDLITITINMLLPIVSLSIYDAVLRLTMDKKYNTQTVFTNGFITTLIGSFVFSIILFISLRQINEFKEYIQYFLILLICYLFQSLFAQFARAIGNVKSYSINGILTTLITGLLNIVFLVNLNMGIRGYLLANIFGLFTSNIFLMFSTKNFNYFKLSKISISTIIEMTRYSVPLIPNSLSLWITNSISRYFILFFVGASGNGLFAVANKIPNIISMLYIVFSQAWQLSVIEEFEKNKQSKVFGEVFDYFASFMLLGTSGLLVVVNFIFINFMSQEFAIAWKYVPFLLLGTVFSSFSGFVGTVYIAAKKTKGILKTSLFGACINIAMNLILVPIIGINGAAFSSMVSYFFIWILRIKDTGKFANIKFNIKRMIMSFVVLMTQIFILYLIKDLFIQILLSFSLFALIVLLNKTSFIPILKLFRKSGVR